MFQYRGHIRTASSSIHLIFNEEIQQSSLGEVHAHYNSEGGLEQVSIVLTDEVYSDLDLNLIVDEVTTLLGTYVSEDYTTTVYRGSQKGVFFSEKTHSNLSYYVINFDDVAIYFSTSASKDLVESQLRSFFPQPKNINLADFLECGTLNATLLGRASVEHLGEEKFISIDLTDIKRIKSESEFN